MVRNMIRCAGCNSVAGQDERAQALTRDLIARIDNAISPYFDN
jgi:hypothetical protein